jgi:hypothetical protein
LFCEPIVVRPITRRIGSNSTSPAVTRSPPRPRDSRPAIAVGLATVSRQPRLPHRQIAPCGSTVTCPSSPASPPCPSSIRPSHTTPAPMPEDSRRYPTFAHAVGVDKNPTS